MTVIGDDHVASRRQPKVRKGWYLIAAGIGGWAVVVGTGYVVVKLASYLVGSSLGQLLDILP